MLVQRKATKHPAQNYEETGRWAVGLNNMKTELPVSLTFIFDDFVKMRVKMTKREARRLAEMLNDYGRE